MTVKKSRPYRSAVREAQAEETKRRVLDAARRLFTERGYSATPLREVAEKAGVSEQTLYASFGSKAGIVRALVVDIGGRAAGQGGRAELEALEDPNEQVRLMASFERRLFEGGGDVIALLRDAGRSEPELQAAYAAGRSNARDIHRSVIQAWAERRALRAGLSIDEATDIYGALANFDVFRMLVQERGWAPADYERWLGDSVSRLLLRDAGRL